VPYLTERHKGKQQQCAKLEDGLKDLQKLFASKRTHFVGGPNGLQAWWASAIETYLRLVITSGWKSVDASEHTAES
jgi:hypothetical protein